MFDGGNTEKARFSKTFMCKFVSTAEATHIAASAAFQYKSQKPVNDPLSHQGPSHPRLSVLLK